VTAQGREWREAIDDGQVSAMRCTLEPQLHASLIDEGGGEKWRIKRQNKETHRSGTLADTASQ